MDKRRGRRGLVLLQVQFIPFGPFVSLYYCRYNFPLSRGRSICRNDFVVLPLPPWGRREKLARLWWHAGEEEEGKACGKSVRVKAIFRRSFSFHPRKEYHSFLLLAIYLTTTKFLRNRFSPSAIQTANYLRSRRSTFNTGRENTYITFVIGGEDEWLSTVAVFASYNLFNSGKMKFFRPLFLSLSLVQARLIEGTDENYRTRSVINLWFQVYFN